MFAGLIAVAAAIASPFSDFKVSGIARSNPSKLGSRGVDLCNPCIQIGEQGINILLNEILNAGVIGGCGKLCSVFPDASKEKVCDLVCDVVGLKAFINALNKTDIDPLYFCEELKLCPVGFDNASATVDGTVVDPESGHEGDTFTMELDFTVINATGTGEIKLAVKGPGGISLSQGFVNEGFVPGKYASSVKLTAQDDPSADPPLKWLPGTYTYAFMACQSECGSKHPHAKVFGQIEGSFAIE